VGPASRTGLRHTGLPDDAKDHGGSRTTRPRRRRRGRNGIGAHTVPGGAGRRCRRGSMQVQVRRLTSRTTPGWLDPGPHGSPQNSYKSGITDDIHTNQACSKARRVVSEDLSLPDRLGLRATQPAAEMSGHCPRLPAGTVPPGAPLRSGGSFLTISAYTQLWSHPSSLIIHLEGFSASFPEDRPDLTDRPPTLCRKSRLLERLLSLQNPSIPRTARLPPRPDE
jgi:hypothetical protein